MDTSTPAQPAAPNYAQANVSGVASDAATLAARRQIEQAAKLGTSTTYTLPIFNDQGQIQGWNAPQTADFTGLGDTALQAQSQQQQIDLMKSATPELLGLQQQYGTQFVEEQRKQQQASDPEAFALRQQLGQQLQDELSKGGELTP